MNKRNNRRDTEEDGEWWDVMAKMGMPLLYMLGISTGSVGAICQGVITSYWANLEKPSCYLYARTASTSVVYKFGSSIGVCHWVTYGTVVAVMIAFIAGLVYIIKVRSSKDLTYTSGASLTGILVAFLLMLAVTCTVAEGMRITCASMGLNAANNKGESCYEKLDKRVAGDFLPVLTSTLVRVTLINLICSTVTFFIIFCFHLSDFYRRTLKYRYNGVSYEDRD